MKKSSKSIPLRHNESNIEQSFSVSTRSRRHIVTNDLAGVACNNNENNNTNEAICTMTTENITQSTCTCLDFGRDREKDFPDVYFCGNCYYFEEQQFFKKKPSNNRSLKKYRCKAKHVSVTEPTLKKDKLYYRNRKIESSATTISPSNDSVAHVQHVSNAEIDLAHNDNAKRVPTIFPQNDDTALEYNDIVSDYDDLLHEFTKLLDENKYQLEIIEYLTEKNETLEQLLRNLKPLVQTRNEVVEENSSLLDENSSLHESIACLKRKLEFDENQHKVSISCLKRKLEIDESQHQKKMSQSKKKIDRLYESKKQLNDKLTVFKDMSITSIIATDIFCDNMMLSILDHSKQKNRNVEKLCTRIINKLWNSTYFGSLLRFSMIDTVKQHLRKTIFHPAKILELLDMNGGQLSFQGMNLVRSLETGGRKNVRNTIIPHSSSIIRFQSVLDKYASKIVPFTVGKLENESEFIEFCPKNVIQLMYRAYKLDNIAIYRSIKIDQAIDSAKISTRQHVTVWGLKMVDYEAKDPKNGELLVGSIDVACVQSRKNCFPLKIALDRESNAVIDQFQPNMLELKNLTKCKIGKFKPITCTMGSDLAATWKLLKMGGAYKNTKYGCHLCAEHESWVGQCHGVKCNEWCKKLHANDESMKCRHQPIFSKKNVAAMRGNLRQLISAMEDLLPKLNYLEKHTSVHCDEDPRGITDEASRRNIRSIHFDLESDINSEDMKDEYSHRITNDLIIREINPMGSAITKQKKLQESLIMEWSYRQLSKSINYHDKNANLRLLSILECVPCILHMECRCGIKILTMLLNDGITAAGDGDTFKQFKTKKKRLAEFAKKVDEIANKEVFGSEERPAFWHLPFDCKNEVLDSITLDNNRTRALINNLDSLVDLCIINEGKKKKFLQCIEYYKSLFVMLRRKEDFSDDDILQFQAFADYFYKEWIELYRREGVTNYIHMIGSGHVADFLTYYRNLYRHSQQGWEHLNSFLKVYFFRRTMRGGGKGNGSKIEPLARWLARRMIWMAGISVDDILNDRMSDTYEDNDSNETILDTNDEINVHDDVDVAYDI